MPEIRARSVRIHWLAIVLSAGMVGQLAAEGIARGSLEYIKKLSFGNLRKLNLQGGNGHYTLNNVELPTVSSDCVELITADRAYKVRATFLKTVLISKSRPVNLANQDLVRTWAREIPLVAHILSEQDSLGSMKPVVYDLAEPRGMQDLQLQEELVLLWSADPADESKIGETRLLPPMPFPGQIVDVQYRGIKGAGDRLVGKIILQILYIRDKGRPATLGAFAIVSKPSGDFEFYLVPRSLLDQIVIGGKQPERRK